MKINRSGITSKKVLLVALAVVVLVLGFGTYALMHRADNKHAGVVTPVTKNGKTSFEIQDRPVGAVNDDTPTADEASPATDSLPTQPETDTTAAIPVTISYAGGSPLAVRTIINELLPDSTCTLTLEKSGQSTVTQTAPVFVATNYSTCKGFSVPTTALAKGTWNLTITVTSGSRTGTAAQEVTLS